MENNKNVDAARIVGGLILVGTGVAFLLRNMGYSLPYWLFTWPMILVLVGIYSAFKSNFQGFSWVLILGIGIFFLSGKIYRNIDFDKAFWPVAIIALGFMFIFRPKKDRISERNGSARFNDKYSVPPKIVDETAIDIDSTDFLYVNSVFSGVNKHIMSKHFQGGRIRCIFGGADIDFMQADINGRVILRMEIVFGGTKIVVPANWTIVNEIDGLFHGVDDKRKTTSVLPDPGKVLVLRGSATFGGVDIRSY